MLTLLAQLGNRSLQVNVDPQTGVITLPPDTTLENGRWILLQDDTEIGAFDVEEGVVGTAYSTRPEPRVVILDLSFVDVEEAPRPRGIRGTVNDLFSRIFGQGSRRRREEARTSPGTLGDLLRMPGMADAVRRHQEANSGTLAEMLAYNLFMSEQSIRILDEKPCDSCHQVHSHRFLRAIGSSPEHGEATLADFIARMREEGVEARLEAISAEDSDPEALAAAGYGDSRQGAQAHLERLRLLFARPSKSPAPAPAADPSGESASP